MADVKEIQELKKIMKKQNVANGTIDLNDEIKTKNDYLYKIL